MCVRACVKLNYTFCLRPGHQELRDRKVENRVSQCNKFCLAGTLSLKVLPFKKFGLYLYEKPIRNQAGHQHHILHRTGLKAKDAASCLLPIGLEFQLYANSSSDLFILPLYYVLRLSRPSVSLSCYLSGNWTSIAGGRVDWTALCRTLRRATRRTN